jgi:hypothetical protein
VETGRTLALEARRAITESIIVLGKKMRRNMFMAGLLKNVSDRSARYEISR